MEIIHFANQVIAPYRNELTPASPVFRSGEPVRVIKVENGEKLSVIGETASRLIDGGAHTVAVVARTEQACLKIYEALKSKKLNPNLITTQLEEYHGGLSVAPVYLTKGMEFDAVLLIDVDERHYPDNELNAKLLYVGCTRALHQLYLFYDHKPSPLIKEMDPDLYITQI